MERCFSLDCPVHGGLNRRLHPGTLEMLRSRADRAGEADPCAPVRSRMGPPPAEGYCVACSGTGVSSRGDACHPCGGSGRVKQ